MSMCDDAAGNEVGSPAPGQGVLDRYPCNCSTCFGHHDKRGHDELRKSHPAGVARMSATQKGHWQSSCNLGETIRYQLHRLDRSRTHKSAGANYEERVT
jgi:hypothetical protein